MTMKGFSRKGRKIVFRILLIAAIAVFALWLVCLLFKPDITGTVLNERLLGAIRMDYIRSCVSVGAVYVWMFLGVAALVLHMSNITTEEDKKFSNAMLVCTFIFTGLAVLMSVLSVPDIIPALIHEPEVETVAVTDKDSEFGGGTVFSRRTHYYLYFDDGNRRAVSYDVYNETEPGERFYLILCGDQVIRALDASDYSLAQA